jgi:hypothetical protein
MRIRVRVLRREGGRVVFLVFVPSVRFWVDSVNVEAVKAACGGV